MEKGVSVQAFWQQLVPSITTATNCWVNLPSMPCWLGKQRRNCKRAVFAVAPYGFTKSPLLGFPSFWVSLFPSMILNFPFTFPPWIVQRLIASISTSLF